jgi:hypothetical protein
MPPRTLRVHFWDAERPWQHFHAERGNDRSRQSPLCKSQSLQFAFTARLLRNVLVTVHKDTDPTIIRCRTRFIPMNRLITRCLSILCGTALDGKDGVATVQASLKI